MEGVNIVGRFAGKNWFSCMSNRQVTEENHCSLKGCVLAIVSDYFMVANFLDVTSALLMFPSGVGNIPCSLRHWRRLSMTWSGQDQVFKSLSLHHLRGSLSGVKVMEICRLIIHLSCMPSEMSGTCLDCECLEDYMVYNHSQQHLIAILKNHAIFFYWSAWL